MVNAEIVNPNIANFIHSLRDIGYSFEVAVADLIDNSIAAKAASINIYTVTQPVTIFSMLDDGFGMDEHEIVEAMRLSSKSPLELRDKSDLGRFGLGLKTASFSQCRKLTVVSKKNNITVARQWDLDYISEKNEWLLITPTDVQTLPLYEELSSRVSGTLITWELLDRLDSKAHAYTLDKLRNHLSLVFHRYIEGVDRNKGLKIIVNNNIVLPFNPFNVTNNFTQELPLEKVWLHGSLIKIQPYILPHHSKLSQQEYNLYATEEGYIKSQGFYLYRRNRILIYGTWWGLHKALDAHKLVRIKIDIENDIDSLWGIDIKKSIARPCDDIRNDLKRIIALTTQRGSRPFTGRGKKIEDKSTIQVWNIIPINNQFRFVLNRSHPIFTSLLNHISSEEKTQLDMYLKAVEAYLPLDAIQYNLQANPHSLAQNSALSENDIIELADLMKSANLPDDYINALLKTELFINRPELLS
jgi:Histidine kinase-, DNA gyrase B-, and HSP90-like ATPase